MTGAPEASRATAWCMSGFEKSTPVSTTAMRTPDPSYPRAAEARDETSSARRDASGSPAPSASASFTPPRCAGGSPTGTDGAACRSTLKSGRTAWPRARSAAASESRRTATSGERNAPSPAAAGEAPPPSTMYLPIPPAGRRYSSGTASIPDLNAASAPAPPASCCGRAWPPRLRPAMSPVPCGYAQASAGSAARARAAAASSAAQAAGETAARAAPVVASIVRPPRAGAAIQTARRRPQGRGAGAAAGPLRAAAARSPGAPAMEGGGGRAPSPAPCEQHYLQGRDHADGPDDGEEQRVELAGRLLDVGDGL